MANNSKASATADERPPSLFPSTADAAEKGKRRSNRNYPSMTLQEALVVSSAIQEDASGTAVSRLTLADLVKKSPESSAFRELIMASRLYG